MDNIVARQPRIGVTRGRRWRRRILVGLTALLAAGVAGIAALAVLRPALVGPFGYEAVRERFGLTQEATPPTRQSPRTVRVVAERAAVGNVSIQLTAIGTVQAFNTVNLQSRVDGAITAILFQEGQMVQKGDQLIEIDPRPYQALLSQASATREKDVAMLMQAMLDAQRYDRLAQDSFGSRQQAEQQRSLVSQYSAQLRIDTAQIEYATTQLGYTRIAAPISGQIGIRNVDIGNVVRASDTGSLAVITQLQPISVVLTLSAQSLGRTALTIGQTDAPVVAVAQNGTTILDTGRVQLVNNTVDPNTGTIKLKAQFANDKRRLWPGDFVRGQVTVAERKGAVTVPVTAVRHGPRGDFIWTVTAENTAHVQGVTVEQTANGRSLVERGLDAGQLVVTDGYYQLAEGTPVAVQEPKAAGRGSLAPVP